MTGWVAVAAKPGPTAASLAVDPSHLPPGKRTVLLKIHRDTPYRDFEPVIEAVSAAGGELHHVLEEKN